MARLIFAFPSPRGPLGVVLLGALTFPMLSLAGVYRCTNANGEIYFSDVACPADFDKEILSAKPRSGRQSQRPYVDDPYSVVNQVRGIAPQNRAPEGPPILQGPTRNARGMPVPQQPVLTYEAALKLATKDAGYKKYGRLTGTQKDRVHREMRKYRYLPEDYDGSGARAAAERAEQARVQQAREEHKRQHIRDVERTYEKEKRWQELGVQGRGYKYADAVKECKETFMANCK